MGSGRTLLAELRSKSMVDCDTLDASVAQALGPFEDCTSNQAIAYHELLHSRHAGLIAEAVATAHELSARYPDIATRALGVEICMVKLGLLMLPHLNGRIHIQANPFDAYSTKRTIAGARRIIAHFQQLSTDLSAKDRVCIKIPSTWEGLQACRVLERDYGITTLATTLFSLEQAAVAAEAGCRYIAPYVNELAVHFEAGFVDPSPNQHICIQSQLYFERYGYGRTATLPASLTSVTECMSLSGVRHITIAPTLLQALDSTAADGSADAGSSRPDPLLANSTYLAKQIEALPKQRLNLIDDEERFRILFTRRDGGKQEIKQVKAINVFADMQTKLEDVVGGYLD